MRSEDARVFYAPNEASIPACLDAGPDVFVFLDVDGTILGIAETPGAVFVPDILIEVLSRVVRQLEGAVALVSGRAIKDIDRLFSPLRLRAAGVHGAQLRLNPARSTQELITVATLPNAFAPAVKNAVERFPGVLIENKGFSIAVHYCLNPQAARRLRGSLQELLQAASLSPVVIEEAHCAFELKPPSFDKGKAIALSLNESPFRGRSPIFVGDDTADEAGFAEVTARGGYAYSVGRPRRGVVGWFSRLNQSATGWLFSRLESANDPRASNAESKSRLGAYWQ